MKKQQKILLAISILCALAIMVVGIVMIFSQTEQTPPEEETSQKSTELNGEHREDQDTTPVTPETTEGTAGPEEDVKQPPTDLPPKVEIKPEEDPEDKKPQTLKFPCQVPGYKLTLEKIAPYDGTYVEDGTNVNVEQVAMLMVKNDGEYPIEYTQIAVEFGGEQLIFDISALPVGERLVVQEKTCKKMPAAEVTKATALVVQRAELEMNREKIRVTDNGNNTLTIENLTEETFANTRVFYKYFMEKEDLFVGGIAFTVRVRNLGPKEKVTVQPAHYNSTTSRVVMVQTYDN